MGNIKRSEYIITSRVICKKLYTAGCFGKGSMYFDNIVKGISFREFPRVSITKDKAKIVIEALVKQNILGKKKKEHGWKYYLNMERIDKIKEIIKETDKKSIIPILLML